MAACLGRAAKMARDERADSHDLRCYCGPAWGTCLAIPPPMTTSSLTALAALLVLSTSGCMPPQQTPPLASSSASATTPTSAPAPPPPERHVYRFDFVLAANDGTSPA